MFFADDFFVGKIGDVGVEVLLIGVVVYISSCFENRTNSIH